MLLTLYTLSVALVWYAIEQKGGAALTFIAILVSVFLLIRIKIAWFRQRKQIKKVLLALINEDPTLGLPPDNPLLLEFNSLKERIETSLSQLHVHNHFFESLIQNIDSAVLVVDENNTIIHKNSAFESLTTGANTEFIDSSWGELGTFILNAKATAQRTIKWKQNQHIDTFIVRLTHSHFLDRSIKILIIQSIHEELVDNELDTYKRLTRVLIHEVSNSVTPISMLTQTTQQLMHHYLEKPHEQDKEDITEALNAVQTRVVHLSTFVNRFKELGSVPRPNMQFADLKAVINNVLLLLKGQLQENGVRVYLQCAEHESFKTEFDTGQIEQVLVNIVKNGSESMTNSPEKNIYIKLYYNTKNKLLIDIADTGPGIPAHVQEKVFIPFFTTKSNGSGIGLSLCKQIMRNHNGDLTHINEDKNPNSGACFRVSFS